MGNAPTNSVSIQGHSLGPGTSNLFDPFYLFKGKLRAAATRAMFHDSADLRMLAGRYKSVISPRAKELNLEYVGLAIKRYLALERVFEQIGVDLVKARQAAKDLDLDDMRPLVSGDVQRGLLG